MAQYHGRLACDMLPTERELLGLELTQRCLMAMWEVQNAYQQKDAEVKRKQTREAERLQQEVRDLIAFTHV